MEKCKRMKRQLCMLKSWIYSWLWRSSKTRQQYCRSESFAMKTGIPTNGSMVKNHISLKSGIRIICNTENFVPIVVPGLSSSSSASSSTLRTPMKQESHSSSSSSSSSSSPTVGEILVREREDAPNSDISPVPVSEFVDGRSGKPEEIQANQIPIKKQPRQKGETRVVILRFRKGCKNSEKNLVDDEIPLQGGSHASSSHEVFFRAEYKGTWGFGEHSVYSIKDRNFEICKRTEIRRAPCRRRNGEAALRATNFGELIIADHKVLSDNCESRNNHRYAVVVQYLATQMDPGVSVQEQNFTRNPEKLTKVPGTREETKSHLHWQILGTRQSLWRSLLESLHVCNTLIGD